MPLVKGSNTSLDDGGGEGEGEGDGDGVVLPPMKKSEIGE
jgi:hypothetical protein